MAFSQNLSALLKGGTTPNKDKVSEGHIQSSFEFFFSPQKVLLSNVYIFKQELAAVHHARIAMPLLGMQY